MQQDPRILHDAYSRNLTRWFLQFTGSFSPSPFGVELHATGGVVIAQQKEQPAKQPIKPMGGGPTQAGALGEYGVHA